MRWTELASACLNGSELVLYHDDADGAFMIRVGGLELMNSRWHRSEDELGALVATAMGWHPNPRILLGGLGLSYTLAALVRALGGAGSITVAEISADVVAWYERWFEPRLFAGRPENVRLVVADVAALLREKGDYEVTDAALRMSVSPASPVDNFHAGGIAAAVDVRTGRLGQATDLGMGPDFKWHDVHPLTGAQITGRQLPVNRQHAIDFIRREVEAARANRLNAGAADARTR